MPVDRITYKAKFDKDSPPQWICPVCNRAVLKGKADSFLRTETKESAQAHSNDDWEPEWTRYIYSCQFVCTNPTCEETVFSIGTGSVDSAYLGNNDEYPEQVYFDVFDPTFFIPHLNIFQISKNTPENIKDSIEKSFELFFANPSAAANHLRIALEQLLDYLKVKKFGNSNGKKYIISLHQRIGLIPIKFSQFKQLFFAIKWLGNDASHITGVDKDDVMDAYDIFESILDEVFGQKTKQTLKLAMKINRNRKLTKVSKKLTKL